MSFVKIYRTARKSAQRFHQFSCSLWFSSCSKLGICHMFISWWCLLALHFHWDLCWTPSKTLRFLDGFVFRHSASDSFPSPQLADRLCSDITHMYVSPLPSLDICHDHWTSARQATWRHLFTGLPATIYCTSLGKDLWAASLDTARSLCKLAFGAAHKLSVQRNMKCGHRSTTEVCNVTWSVVTEVQQKCAT